MQKNSGHAWLFLDLNSYFASVEQNENPQLRGKPVAVIPSNTDYTCAIAASYEAKAYGVKTGTMIKDAKKMCPNLICVMARHDMYVRYHNRIIEEVIKHIPINKIWSIDELSSRLPPSKRSVEAVQKISQNIKHGLWNNIGPAINCSIGVAPNSLLAKIAGEMQKPDGLTLLPQESLPGRLLDLRLRDLPGIGVNMEKRLLRAGVTSIQEFWNISPKHARKIWGSVQGERFWYWLHGYDFEAPPLQRNVMIGHSRVLDPKMRHPDNARHMARSLLVKAAQRLRHQNYYAGALSLGIRTCDGRRWQRDIRLPNPAQDPFTLLEYQDQLWSAAMIDLFAAPANGSYRGALQIKKLSVVLTDLKTTDEITGDIMVDGYQDALSGLKKRESLTKALDALDAKYSKDTVTLGTPAKSLSGYIGTKIAFSRVPDQEEF